MDLDEGNFADHLLEMLRHISRADFVAFDFEFSGIKVNSPKTVIEQRVSSPEPIGLPTLQERYEEVRQVAKKYTILQVGLTIAEQDRDTGGYVLRSYNTHLSPLIRHRLNLSRDVVIESSAADFLLKNNFDMGAPFSDGVPYLSRDEHLRCIQLESEKLDGFNLTQVDFGTLDDESRLFLQRTRERIHSWLERGLGDKLIIPGPQLPGQSMSMLHRKVVHQLIRSEFPKLRSVAHSGGMKAVKLDLENEYKQKRMKMDAFYKRLSKQVGFRWIIDALTGGTLNDLDVECVLTSNGPRWVNLGKLKEELDAIRGTIRNRRPVLVGHNPFIDLVYLYAVFIGEPPSQVEKFAAMVQTMFPLVIDTKYLATHHGVVDSSSLQQLKREYEHQSWPRISMGQEFESAFDDYRHRRRAHQAGWDSYATAMIAIRSAAKLAAQFEWQKRLEDLRVKSSTDKTAKWSKMSGLHQNQSIDRARFEAEKSQDEPLIDLSDGFEYQASSKGLRTVRESAYLLGSIFTAPMLCHWRDAEMGTIGAPDYILPDPVDPVNSDPDRWKLIGGIAQWMPAWNSPFWLLFGNKLRVNGTVEGVLDIAFMAKPAFLAVSTEGA